MKDGRRNRRVDREIREEKTGREDEGRKRDWDGRMERHRIKKTRRRDGGTDKGRNVGTEEARDDEMTNKAK